jgi:hypothetical protein
MILQIRTGKEFVELLLFSRKTLLNGPGYLIRLRIVDWKNNYNDKLDNT